MTAITRFRVSFVWIETVPAILAKEVAPGLPGFFLGHVGKYAEAFDRCRAGNGPPGFALPWTRPMGNHYWRFAFAGRHAGDIDGASAWRQWVPFRTQLPYHAEATAPPKVTFEAFCAPPGIALVANAYYRGPARTPLEVAGMAQAVRETLRFRAAPPPAGDMRLETFAERALRDLVRRLFGDVSSYGGSHQPFTIATIVQGADVDPDTAMTEGSPEHRLLEAVTGWNRNYATMALPAGSLAACTLPRRKTGAAGDVVYARDLGRAVWLPREFTTPQQAPRLSCYHRNLLMASVRTLAIGEFVDWTARTLQGTPPPYPLLIERAKQAATLLAASAEGERAVTYRSKSIDALVAAAAWHTALDRIGLW